MKAILHTSAGDITVELFPNHAPNTVNNFVTLAKGEREWVDPTTGQKTSRPLYDGTIFHRVIPGFITVAPTPWLLGNHTIFGKVADEESKRVVDAIATTPTGAQDRPVTEQVINSIEIVD